MVPHVLHSWFGRRCVTVKWVTFVVLVHEVDPILHIWLHEGGDPIYIRFENVFREGYARRIEKRVETFYIEGVQCSLQAGNSWENRRCQQNPTECSGKLIAKDSGSVLDTRWQDGGRECFKRCFLSNIVVMRLVALTQWNAERNPYLVWKYTNAFHEYPQAISSAFAVHPSVP